MFFLSITLIAISAFTAMAATIPGIFLTLRGISLMSDAISHAILPGIVIMFLICHQLNSAWLLVGASLAGLLVVFITQSLIDGKYLQKEVAIGLVFPFFFSIGVILICQYTRDVHLDADMVLLGDIVFTPFSLLVYRDIILGPYALWLMGMLVIGNALLVTFFYKELVVTSFDEEYAYACGLRPRLCYYLLMALTSITAVAAFNVVGTIVVVALTIIPAATALLLSNRLETVMALALLISLIASVGGYVFAYMCGVSIAGALVLVAGFLLLVTLVASPFNGAYSYIRRYSRGYRECTSTVLCMFIAKEPLACDEAVSVIASSLGWSRSRAISTIRFALSEGWLVVCNGYYQAVKNSH